MAAVMEAAAMVEAEKETEGATAMGGAAMATVHVMTEAAIKAAVKTEVGMETVGETPQSSSTSLRRRDCRSGE